MELFETLQVWHWIVLGLLLIGAETLGAGGFLLGTAVAAFLASVILYLMPEISWEAQLVVFAVMSMIFTVFWWFFFKRVDKESDTPNLNDRASQLIGRTATLGEPTINGQGRVQIGDTYWKVTAERDIQAETIIKVVASDGMTLKIEPV